MAAGMTMTVIGARETAGTFSRLAAQSPGSIRAGLLAGGLLVQNAAKHNVRNLPLYKTGTLMRGITTEAVSDYEVKIGVDLGTVPYARIHEFGGVIKPKNGPFLVFEIGGQVVRARSVTMPARPYLRPALAENREAVRKEVRDALFASLLGSL